MNLRCRFAERQLVFGSSLLLAGAAWAQEPGRTAVPVAPPAPSVVESILHGGVAMLLVWLCLLAASVAMVSLVVRAALTLRRSRMVPGALVETLAGEIQAGNYQNAWETCRAQDNYFASVLRAGLERLGRGPEAVAQGVAEAALRETMLLRTRNGYLSAIGVVAPLLGVLGAVIGAMRAFGAFAGEGLSNPRLVAGKIQAVLLVAAAGLLIALPALIAHYLFRGLLQRGIAEAEEKIDRLLADVPHEELAGLRIGENFSIAGAGAAPGGDVSRRVSMALTTNCPRCNGAISPGQNPCPHCGSALEWAG